MSYKVRHYQYKNRIGNLKAEAVGVVSGEKHFPIFPGDMIFKPLTKSKPFSTPLYAYAEVFWSTIINEYFMPAPRYELAICEGYEAVNEKYLDYGTAVPMAYKEGESLLNLLEFFRKYPDEKVDIDNYVNYCQMFYDYRDIFEAAFFQEHREGPGNEAVRDPGRQKLTQYAEAFEGLSETFLKLPKLKEDLEKEDREEILKETSHQVCRDCEAMEWCWSEHREDTLREAYERLFSMEKGEEELPRLSFCIRSDRFLAELRLKYQLARQNLLWTNRLFASRRIMMDQFQEIAGIIRRAAGAIYEVDEVDTQVRRILEVQMKLHGIGVREMWKVERPDGCRELYVTMRALGKKRCVGMREAAACLSSACGERMIPARDSRMVINQDYSTVMFMPAPEYMMLCGAARVTRDGEVVSGDSFAVYHRDT